MLARATGPFIRAARSAERARELVFGQWGLMPWFAQAARLAYRTNNARFEELGARASFKQPWAQGQPRIIPASDEIVERYTMLTLNADSRSLMRRMHKPDPKLGPDQQDKRSVVAIELAEVDTWPHGTQEAAATLVKLPSPQSFAARPALV